MANATFFIEDLMAAHNLAPALQSPRFLQDRKQRLRSIDHGILYTPPLTKTANWKKPTTCCAYYTGEWQPTDHTTGYTQTRYSTVPTKDVNALFAEDCGIRVTLYNVKEEHWLRKGYKISMILEWRFIIYTCKQCVN